MKPAHHDTNWVMWYVVFIVVVSALFWLLG